MNLLRRLSCLAASGVVIVLLAASACRQTDEEFPSYRVGTWKTAQTIQPFYYERFLPAGTRIEVSPFTNPADQKAALLAGSLDMCGTTLAHAIHSASQGQPVVVVAALCNKCSALVVHRDSAINSAQDLKGTKIAYVPGTMHEVLLRETLTRAGVSPERDAELMRVDFFDMGTALQNGDVAAFLSGEPFPTLATTAGYGRILSYPYFDESIGSINAGMLVRRETIETAPDRVMALVRAHAEATRHLRGHPDEWLSHAVEFGTELEILQAAAPNMELAWEMDERFVQRARALGARMHALGMIEREPDYDRLFDRTFVERLNGEMQAGGGSAARERSSP